MPWSPRIALGLIACWASSTAAGAQEPPAKPKARIELRWVEDRPVEGLTEEEGFQTSCDPDSIAYPHKKPALVLSSTEVADARLTKHDFSPNGLSSANYIVTIRLTKEAREELARACEGKGKGMRLLTVVVDGEFWGIHRYEIDASKPFVPEAARAETFTPSVGFFSSRLAAQRVVDALQ